MTFFKLFAFAAKPLIQTTILRCLKGKQIIERSKHCLELFLTLRPPRPKWHRKATLFIIAHI